MKKIAIFVLAAVTCISLVGCRSNMEVEPLDTTPVATQPITTPPATTIPDTIDDIPNVPDPSVDNGTLEDLITDNEMNEIK